MILRSVTWVSQKSQPPFSSPDSWIISVGLMLGF